MDPRFLAICATLVLMFGGPQLYAQTLVPPAARVGDEHARTSVDRNHPADDVKLTLLTESLQPLKKRFNDHKDKVRFIALLSPT